jgi:hypothetical protein
VPASPRRVLAALLATAAGAGVLAAGAASAHNPRETPPGAPRMDLEVLVTPELEGRITPGGTDPLVSVDGFGNRFAVARKEDAQTAVGVDQRAGTAVRAAAWAWTSADDGLTWSNLETVTRGLDGLLPQGTGRDLASAGPLTAHAESYGPVVVVTRVLAQRKGQLAGQPPTVVPVPGGAPGAPALALTPTAALLAVPQTGGGTAVLRSTDAGATFTAGPVLPGGCDVAADPRPGGAFHAACAEGGSLVLLTSRDGGASFPARTVLGALDPRGGAARPQVDVGPDGTPYALSGLRLSRVVGGRVVAQDLALPPGDVHGVSFAVSSKGRVAAAAHHRASPGAAWHVQVALFDPGARPTWYDFSDHDPVAPRGAAEPAAAATSIDTDPQGRLQLVWGATFLQSAELGRPLLRNVFAARSVTA